MPKLPILASPYKNVDEIAVQQGGVELIDGFFDEQGALNKRWGLDAVWQLGTTIPEYFVTQLELPAINPGGGTGMILYRTAGGRLVTLLLSYESESEIPGSNLCRGFLDDMSDSTGTEFANSPLEPIPANPGSNFRPFFGFVGDYGDNVYLLDTYWAWQGNSSICFKYSKSSDTWTKISDSPLASSQNSACAQIGKKLYLLTGNFGVADTPQQLYCFDMEAETWTLLAPFPGVWDGANYINSWGGSMTTDGTDLYVTDCVGLGGYTDRDLRKYSPATDTWTTLAQTPLPTSDSSLVHYNGVLYQISGDQYDIGTDTTTNLKSIRKYDIASGVWSTSSKELPEPLYIDNHRPLLVDSNFFVVSYGKLTRINLSGV